jgi:hypothetical protein
MSIEQINGYNKLPSKDLRRAEPQKAKPGDVKRPESDSVEISKQGKPDQSESTDALKASSSERPLQETQAFSEFDEKRPVDSLELSWRDPEVVERIRKLVEEIKESKDRVAKRIEAARILIMHRAYDDNHQLRETAEAILRGEDLDNLELD